MIAPLLPGRVESGVEHRSTVSASKSRTFDALYRAHASQVMRWASRLGGPQVDAEDVTQEVFLVVHRRLGSLHRNAKPTTWIFAVTANVVKAHLRRSYLLRLVRKLDRYGPLPLASPVPTPLETVEQRRAGAIVYDILNQMTETHRRAFVLRARRNVHRRDRRAHGSDTGGDAGAIAPRPV